MTGTFTAWAGCMFLVFLRVLSTFALSPVFGKHIPNIAKIVISITLSYIVVLTIEPQNAIVFNTVLEYVVACVKEVFLGLIFSYVVLLLLSTVYAAGQVVDMELGFSFATLYSADLNAQTPLTGNLFNVIIMLMFFILNGHLNLLELIIHTFNRIPPGTFVFSVDFVRFLIELFALAFSISIKVAMPIIIVSLAAQVLLGVVMKVVPQMNFFVIGFPVKIFLGLIILLAFLPTFINVYEVVFNNIFEAIQKVFEGLS